MRILKISDVYFPRVNGVSTSIRTFAHELQVQGHDVTLIAPTYPQPLEDTFEIIRIPSRYIVVDPEDRLMQRRPLRRQLDYLQRKQFDVIHIHTPFAAHYEGIWLGRELGLPVVETYHTYFEEYLDKYLPWLPRKALRYTARRFSRSQCDDVDAVVVPSRPMHDVLRDYGIKAQAEVIPTGIPAGAFANGNGRRFRVRHGIADDRQILLYVGRVAHEKNIDFLIKVADAVRETHPKALLVIAGEGPAIRHLRRVTRDLRLDGHVQFVGYLSRSEDLPDCYAAGDLFTFASSTETQGLVLLEAMQAGTPVVSTAVMGTAEIMADRRGGLVAEESIGDFSSKVRQLLDNPALRAEIGRQATAKAAEWSAPATTTRLLQLYEQCISAKSPDAEQQAESA